MENLLEVKNLKKYFKVPKGDLQAVDNVSFTIKEGETLGIVGESGCGKSTLGRTILRLHEPTSGRIIFQGMDITSFSNEEMRKMRQYMQIIFQDPYASLNPRLTISQSIEESLKVFKLYANEDDRKKRVYELMEMVGLAKRTINSFPHEFDGGRRQRVVIARAIAMNPKFIVCDEPVSALDVSVQAQILNLMIDLQKDLGLTYIFISHDLSVVKHISTNVGVMYLGQMVEKSPKLDLFKNPLHPYTRALLSAIPSVDIDNIGKKIILKGEISSPVNVGNCCRFAGRCPFAKDYCFNTEPILKEVEKDHFVACHRCEEIKNKPFIYK